MNLSIVPHLIQTKHAADCGFEVMEIIYLKSRIGIYCDVCAAWVILPWTWQPIALP